MNLLTSNISYLPIVQLVVTIACAVYFFTLGGSLLLWATSFLLYSFIGALGISIGYHRLLTHRSFKTTKFWEYFCTILGALAFTGSSIGWVGVHRDHHRYSDKVGDPHSPVQSGIMMLFAYYNFHPNKWAIRRLIFDKFHVNLHKYYFGILAAWTLAVYVALGLTMMMHLVIIPATISIWASTISNYMNHKWGYKTFVTTDNSRNNWLNAIFTFGEGWHNNHHARPGEWYFGHKWWELDIGGQIIKLIKK